MKRKYNKVVRRSSQESHYRDIPLENIPRSSFRNNPHISDSFNTGEVNPIFWCPVVPGDTFKVDLGSVLRSQPLIAPIFAHFVVDFHAFFVPMRLVWEHTRQFFGENDQGPYDENETLYSIPKIVPPTDGWQLGTIGEKMDYPFNVARGVQKYSVLPIRAYSLICNEYYRNENIRNPIDISLGDADTYGTNGDDEVVDTQKGGKLYVANKLSDYFTVALPKPQKGESVNLPLTDNATLRLGPSPDPAYNNINNGIDKKFTFWNNSGDSTPKLGFMNGSVLNGVSVSGNWASSPYIDLQGVDATSIIDLRKAFQVQKYLELNSRGGTRYFEFINSHFHVSVPDATIQRPQFLGGKRIILSPQQVVSTAETEQAPQGNMAGYLLSSDVFPLFTNSFCEHGYIIINCTIRYNHTYSQGVPRELLKFDKLDFYDPLFNGIGDQEIFNAEIFSDGTVNDKKIFGYTERYGEYKVFHDKVRGQMRPQVIDGFSHWNLSDNYSSLPHLSEEWIKEDLNNVKRIFSITDENMTNQFFGDFTFNIISTRPMPVYSTPGRMDHSF